MIRHLPTHIRTRLAFHLALTTTLLAAAFAALLRDFMPLPAAVAFGALLAAPAALLGAAFAVRATALALGAARPLPDTPRFVKRDYHDMSGAHRPYREVIHLHPEPRHPEAPSLVDPLHHQDTLAALPDGAVFTIRIIPTGERLPGRVQRTADHTYTVVDDPPQKA